MTGRKVSRSTITGRKYNAIRNCDFETNNIIYCIPCSRCHKQYVGNTKRTVRERKCEHFRFISQNNNAHSVGRHFNTDNHRGLSDVQLYVSQFGRKDPVSGHQIDSGTNVDPQVEVHNPAGSQCFRLRKWWCHYSHYNVVIQVITPVLLSIIHIFNYHSCNIQWILEPKVIKRYKCQYNQYRRHCSNKYSKEMVWMSKRYNPNGCSH